MLRWILQVSKHSSNPPPITEQSAQILVADTTGHSPLDWWSPDEELRSGPGRRETLTAPGAAVALEHLPTSGRAASVPEPIRRTVSASCERFRPAWTSPVSAAASNTQPRRAIQFGVGQHEVARHAGAARVRPIGPTNLNIVRDNTEHDHQRIESRVYHLSKGTRDDACDQQDHDERIGCTAHRRPQKSEQVYGAGLVRPTCVRRCSASSIVRPAMIPGVPVAGTSLG
jgi:hypothetical protein